jgi:hypothetical protein
MREQGFRRSATRALHVLALRRGRRQLSGGSGSQPAACRRASAIGFATFTPTDEGGLPIAALNRMIAAAVRGVKGETEIVLSISPASRSSSEAFGSSGLFSLTAPARS